MQVIKLICISGPTKWTSGPVHVTKSKPKSACAYWKLLSRKLNIQASNSTLATQILQKGNVSLIRKSPASQPTMHCFRAASSNALWDLPSRPNPVGSVPLLVRHCLPQSMNGLLLNKGYQTGCSIVLFLSLDTRYNFFREGVDRFHETVRA